MRLAAFAAQGKWTAFVFILMFLFVLPAAAQTTSIWSATLTVDVRHHDVGGSTTTLKGCTSPGVGTVDDCSVTLSDNEFTYGGTTYTVERLLWASNNGYIVMQFSEISGPEHKTVFGAASLNAGSNVLSFASGTTTTDFVRWMISDPGWTDGEQVSVSLTIPRDPDPEPMLAVSRATVNGRTLVLTYDAALDESSVPAASAFSVSVDRAGTKHPESVSVSGREVRLRLAAAVLAGQRVRVSYRRPPANPIRDVDGNVAAWFGLRAVEHESVEGVPALPLAGVLALAVVLALGGLRRRRA